MKESKRGELIVAVFFLTFFFVLTLISMTYGPKARRLPLIVSVPGIALSAALVLKEIRRLRARGEVAPEEVHNLETTDMKATHGKKKVVVMIGWMALLVAMIWVIGFLATIPIYTILFMRSMKESWGLCILFAVAGFAVLYFLFVVGLNIELYPGLIFEL